MASMGGWLVLGTAASQARARCGRLSHAPREGKNVGGARQTVAMAKRARLGCAR
jgi:hypothetical protein